MNNPNTQLKDLIHVERGIIPANLCDSLVEEIEKNEWNPHSWYSEHQDSVNSYGETEPDVQESTSDHQNLLMPFVIQTVREYNIKYSYLKRSVIVSKFSALRFNRYAPGQLMLQHYDHIKSLFDGEVKGIPILSFVLNLNDDYEGAELFFWDDHVVPLGKGDIIMFPSLFLFPHGVKEASRGNRYSAVCWAV